MPVTIDIKEDLRYQQGISQGKQEGKIEGILEGKEKKNLENATRMFENGLDIALVHDITGLKWNQLETIRQQVLGK